MMTQSERLTALSDAEQEALYGLPDLDDVQRLEYLALIETELALASSRHGLSAQVYLRDPQLERNVHRSQNRIESYHQLRSTIAQVGGKKELTGRTDIEIEISNQCARLIANAVIYYNSAILSRLLTKCEASGNAKALELITQISPAAWRHILLNGHYTFHSGGKMIDLGA